MLHTPLLSPFLCGPSQTIHIVQKEVVLSGVRSSTVAMCSQGQIQDTSIESEALTCAVQSKATLCHLEESQKKEDF